MSLYRYPQLLFKIPYLKNISKVTCHNTSGISLFSSNSGSSGSQEDDDSTSPCCDSNSATYYDCRKYGHDLPSNNVKPDFETLPDIPTGVFRCTEGENLCQSVTAADGTCYQNPEYFSFHHMSYYDMHWALRQYRKTSPDTGRKK